MPSHPKRHFYVRSTGRFSHGQGVVLIDLVPLAEWCRGLGGDDLDLMDMPLSDASPVMGCGARLESDRARALIT
jgi:hypothetical protein